MTANILTPPSRVLTRYCALSIGRLAILGGLVVGTFGLPSMAQGDINQPVEETFRRVASREALTKLAQSGTTQSKNLVELAQESGSFNTLLRAGQAAGLLETLAGQGPYTIFAPTDEAIAALPQGAVAAALRPENKALLRQILLYHVVPGRVASSKLSTGTVKTLGGGIAVRVAGDRIIVNDGSVVRPDIQASNGVAHVVNRLLIPQELRTRLAL